MTKPLSIELYRTMEETPPYELVRYGEVTVTKVIDHKKKACVRISVRGATKYYIHQFSSTSRVSKHLDMMEVKELEDELANGHYFFVADQLVAFQAGAYAMKNGFVHSDATISVLMDVIGCRPLHEQRFNRGRRRSRDEDDLSAVELKKAWSEHGIEVPGMADKGKFSSRLSFGWNPFVKHIGSSFDLVREDTESGVVGLTSWLNVKIPLFNRWIEHLDIAHRQIQNRVHDTIIMRVQEMAKERAAVADLLLMEQHCFDRIHSAGDTLEADERVRLETVMQAVSPRNHLSKFYKDAAFEDKALAAQIPGHLTNMDLYNVAAEIRSHTAECSKSTHAALDRLANRLMFNQDRDFAITTVSGPAASVFADSENAFLGKING